MKTRSLEKLCHIEPRESNWNIALIRLGFGVDVNVTGVQANRFLLRSERHIVRSNRFVFICVYTS